MMLSDRSEADVARLVDGLKAEELEGRAAAQRDLRTCALRHEALLRKRAATDDDADVRTRLTAILDGLAAWKESATAIERLPSMLDTIRASLPSGDEKIAPLEALSRKLRK
jgi:hypothetical protein